MAARDPSRRLATVGLPDVQPEPSPGSFAELATPPIADSLAAPFPLTASPRATAASDLPPAPPWSRAPLVAGVGVVALLVAAFGGWIALSDDAPPDAEPVAGPPEPAAAPPEHELVREPEPALEAAPPPTGADVPADLAPVAAEPSADPEPEPAARPHRPRVPVPAPVIRPLAPLASTSPPPVVSAPPPASRPPPPAVGANGAPILEID